MKAAEVYESITADIIAAIEAGEPGTWMKPWVAEFGMPRNATTRKAYSGGNVLILWFLASNRGYDSQEWATYKQWESVGAQVKKGEKGTSLIKWNVGKCKGTPKDHRCKQCGGMFPTSFTVFNAAQVDGYAPEEVQEGLSESERLAIAEEWFKAIGADVKHGGPEASFVPVADYISMPPFASFHEPAGYYSVMAHEHTHWTGHESRLNREIKNKFGDEGYAMEELVAELGAAFVCATLGISTSPRPSHAQYMANWLTVLRNDSKAIFTAAGMASKAMDFLVESAKVTTAA